MAPSIQTNFDYVIVGGGSAGCVLANRLSADGRNSVALIEAGGRDNWVWLHIPVGYLYAMNNPRADWMFRTEPDPGLGGRDLAYPRGKVIGGSSAINAMIYMRGQAADYDGWRQMGLNHFLGTSEHHSAGGEWRVDKPRIGWKILDAFLNAAGESGIPPTDDFNTGDNEGCGYFQVNQKGGRRWSAARGFLKPVEGRPNLTVITGALAHRLVLDGKRATGVIICDAGREGARERVLTARREVILSAGAVATPPILERSGIGDGARLDALDITPIHHLPGVGENLQDHLQLRPIFKVSGVRTLNSEYRSALKKALYGIQYALFRRGPLTMAPSHIGAFARSAPEYATPNLQLHIQPLSLDKFGDPLHPFDALTVSVSNLRPTSRGSIHAAAADPGAPPRIVTNYLSTEEDRRVAADSLRLARRIVGAPALARFAPQEYKPGAHLQSDEELIHAAGDLGTTIFHPVGTAKMGIDADPMAVTDERLRVRGIAGLRVVDASVMPAIVSGNTNSPTIMIAEKGAAMILADR
jgi:choline dehydrogenase-like flavoprotein